MSPRTVGLFLFERFELLDAAGPVQALGMIPANFQIKLLGPTIGPVASGTGRSVGPRWLAEDTWETAAQIDIVLVPGGSGTRTGVNDQRLLQTLRDKAAQAQYVTSVCTGAALLAKAGLLDGKQATSNKLSFSWVKEQGLSTRWIPEARWVVDGNTITSGGVAAGLDMAFGLIALLHGIDLAEKLSTAIEYEWHKDSTWDPFGRMLR